MKDFIFPSEVGKGLHRPGIRRLVDRPWLYVAWQTGIKPFWSWSIPQGWWQCHSFMLGKLEISFPKWRGSDLWVLGPRRYLYGRFIYRPHMKVIHHFGLHWFTTMLPPQGKRLHKWCQWCGERIVISKGIEEQGRRGSDA